MPHSKSDFTHVLFSKSRIKKDIFTAKRKIQMKVLIVVKLLR